MKKIAIVGAGPTGIYTLFSLLQQQTPLSISIFEQADEAGVGMPYSDEENSKMMLANIASIEIPPIYCTYLEWLQKQEASHLQRYAVKKETWPVRQFLPRCIPVLNTFPRPNETTKNLGPLFLLKKKTTTILF
ncbi:FAD/NAD(P)-binding protein, partial [Escherichia coli]